jgi:hypothetical protein
VILARSKAASGGTPNLRSCGVIWTDAFPSLDSVNC